MKGLLKITLAGCALALLVFSCGSPSGGPSSGGSYRIEGAADMKRIGNGWPLDGDYTLAADVGLAGWPGIGTYDAPFTGVFDGAGKTITLTGEGGVFAYTRGAALKNIRVAGTIARTGAASAYIGGIAGYAENTAIVFCVSTADITLTANGQNASAGGIAGYIRDSTSIRDCASSGTITLQTGGGLSLMVYAGGIAGYSGTGLAGSGSSGCTIVRCASTGVVSARGPFPYAGGIAGYNYTGAAIRESRAAGTVTAFGGELPYAGGIAGYNAGSPSLIENCHATVTVRAESGSGAALAGGIAGANANGARISKCYASGAVTAKVTGSSPPQGNSLGILTAASAGGIAGAQYAVTGNPRIEYCAAFNSALSGEPASGAAYNIFRIAGAGDGGYNNGAWASNIAFSGMGIVPAAAVEEGADRKDGADCGAQPEWSAYAGLGWSLDIWKMQDGYPVLR